MSKYSNFYINVKSNTFKNGATGILKLNTGLMLLLEIFSLFNR